MPEAAGACLLGAAGAAVLGCAWLALALDTHWQQVFGQRPLPIGARRALRLLGATALLAALGLCLLADRPSMAVLVWTMLLALGTVLVAFTLAWRPAWLRRLWSAEHRPAA